ncbi:hypothetical protein [Streptomyces sp. NBC_01198]|uniref:hypothetical protein n=1 Tax=Streptomyces sp. NBC_01198 TaxID=2903769 RepID=UPI002E124AEC|nr:hypothetical protein OG702_19175 [Streptomyces sp. NBC_01198]
MTTPAAPPLKRLTPTTDQTRPAEPASVPAGSSAPKVAAAGVLSAVLPDPHTVTISGILPGLRVKLTGIPVADWLCRCGHHERARGKAAVIELTSRVKVGTCPHQAATTPAAERRKAA